MPAGNRAFQNRERPADPYVLKTYITGTVRAFHEEARAASSCGESRETRAIQDRVPERACRFEAYQEHQLDVLASSPRSRSSYRRGGVFSFLPTEDYMILNGKPCDEWTGAITKEGYGRRKVNKKMWMAHRYSYFLAHGDIDPNLVIDHLCHNRACVEPAHLAQVTRAENSARHKPDCTCTPCTGIGHKWDTCARGHDLNAPGARSNLGKGGCKRCRTEWMRAYRARRKAATEHPAA